MSTYLILTLKYVMYADYTYVIVPASCADTRCSEIDHVESWTRENNLQLNRTKTREIIFTDKRIGNRACLNCRLYLMSLESPA